MEFYRILSIIYYYNSFHEIINFIHVNCFIPGFNEKSIFKNKNNFLKLFFVFRYY